MARSDYRPGRRRKPLVSLILDWAAGVLIGILAIMVGSGLVRVIVAPGAERFAVMLTMSMIVWPPGAALGVWLSVGRPLSGRDLGFGLALAALGSAALTLPLWLELDSDALRGAAAIAALIAAPALARAGIGYARRPSRS